MHLLSCPDAQMGSPKIHLHCPSYSRHSQWPAGISYLLQEGLQVGLIGLPAQRLSPTYYPFQARGPVTANMAVGGHERQDGSWWPPYRAPPAKASGKVEGLSGRVPAAANTPTMTRPTQAWDYSSGNIRKHVVNIYCHCQQAYLSMILKLSRFCTKSVDSSLLSIRFLFDFGFDKLFLFSIVVD